jgi:2-amino-4-hydroxy-6-hydroxymethyldihydropteridine diphosphokinase
MPSNPESKPWLTWTTLPEENAILALGSNLGARESTLQAALDALQARCDLRLVAQSSVHTTAPVGGPEGQADYKNSVALIQTTMTPEELLSCLQTIELLHGRTRDIEWGPRTLDLDLLMHGAETRTSPLLILPHPRMHERTFVLAPLVELLPKLTLATGETVAKALMRQRAARLTN